MHQTEQEHLIDMINQIAVNNISLGDDSVVADMIAGHVKKFWPRRMKVILNDYVIKEGGERLHPAALLASKKLSKES